MRLRIKTFDGRLERISVADNSTLGDLQKQVAGVFPTLGPGGVMLSLNRKVEVDGAAKDLLRTAGICGGDTLWILSEMQEAHKPNTQQLEQAQQIPDIAISSAPDLLQRVLDSCTTALQSSHQLLLLTLHAVLLETGMQLKSQDETYALPNEARAKCSSVCQLQYCLQRCQSEPSYEVKYISLGAGMACIAASFDGSRITTLNVSLEQHLHLQQTGFHSGEAVSSFKNLQKLWTELKDGLALKMLAGLRQSAGLSPPLGLLALPAELKNKILASLQAKDLSAVECCCTELRHTASSNLFWQPLFQQEFGFVTSYESMQAGRLGWQGVFTQKWVERERLRRQPRRNPRLAPFPMRGTFAPPGPPGIITGGDYDRLPQPFLGGTPGMFGGALGGSGFGGQGPPASLFLGGNRGTGRAARAAVM
ncbi:hypothetical protein WJX79_003342 [Trebouxia sp. C0005]